MSMNVLNQGKDSSGKVAPMGATTSESGAPATPVVLPDYYINKAYSLPVIGTVTAEVTINNSSAETGWLDISSINPDTLTLLVDASVSTGTITVDIDFSEDSAGLLSTGYIAQEAGITGNTALKLSGVTGFSYAHYIKIKITETATAAFTFKSALAGRAV